MPKPADNQWRISKRQREGMELCREKRFVLFSGPRLTGKTQGAYHCLADHAHRTDRGNISVVSISQSTGLDSGVWKSITEVTLPQWIESGKLKWHKKPFIANVTKRPQCAVINQFGTITNIQLDSLKHEHEVEERFKSREFSMMYVPELSNFREKKTFDIWALCLRAVHLSYDKFLFLADTNPADDGEDSWIYFLWFVLPNMTYPDYCEYCHKQELPVMGESAFNSYKSSLGVLPFEIIDNPFLSQQEIDALEGQYAHDPDLYDRYLRGLWKKGSTDAMFAKVFRPRFHVIGEIGTPAKPNPEIIVPEPSTTTLITGWDPGITNSAAGVIEKTFAKFRTKKGEIIDKSIFKVLQEQAVIGTPHSLDEFTVGMVGIMESWEARMNRPFEWKHWSDRSVFDMTEPRDVKYYHQIIYEASEGLIIVKAADRGPGSIRQRVNLLKKLLYEGRIFFSNDLAPLTIEMLRALKPGTSELQPIQKGSKHKHLFDWMMYAIASEAYDEIEEMVFERVSTSHDTPATIIQIPT